MAVVSLVISILALLCGVFALIFKRVGPQGERGAVGPQGIQGERGPKGDTGEKGVDGKNGKNGKDGKDGVSVIKETGDLTGEDIIKILSDLEVINFGKGTIIKCDGYYDVD